MHEQHEMRLETTGPTGAEEWFCPTCGRRFVMHWPPAYQKIVLEAGDEYAIHRGGKGGLQMEQPQISDAEEPELPEEFRAAIEKALEDTDLDDL